MMDSQKLLVSRENPRPLAFPTARLISSSVTAKSMPTEIVQKPIPSIVDRFKALLKQRDDELRAAPSYDDDDVPPPSTEEIVQLYELMLSELTFNSKPIITDLTIIAGEQREHGKGIADAICARILEVSVDQKLPSLYLLDSVVKNIGQEYVRYFSSCLPEVFCEAYRQVEPNMHNAMRHLFGTWSTVFPPSVLHKIEAQLQFSQAINNKSSNSNSLGVSESSRPTHGIHVNPKYLRQLEHSTVDNAGGERLESTGSAVQTSFGPGKIHPPFTSRLGRVPSPSGIGPNRPLSASIDEYPVDSSTGKMVERESPSHAAFDYGVGKAIARDEELSEWSRKQLFSDSRNRFPISATYSLSNGHQRQSPRALIDAYGSDKRNESSSNKSLLVDRLDINGMDKVVSTSWQNTEEEEFDWEDMNPTLVDNSRNDGFLPSFSGERPTFSAPNAASLEQDTRSSWSGRPQFPLADDSAAAGEDASVPMGCGRGLLSQVSGFQTQKRPGLGSRHTHDTRNISHHTSNPSQSHVGHARNLPMASIDSIPRADIKPFGIQPSISRMGSSGLDSNVEVHQPILPTSFGMRPPVNMHTARPPILNPIFPFQKHARSQLETINLSNDILAPGPNRSSFALEQQLDGVENKDPTMAKLPFLSNNQTGVIAVNQQIHGQVAFSQPQFGYGSSLLQHSTALSAAMSSSLPVLPFPLPAQNIANNPVPLRGAVPPLPPAPPASSQTINHPHMRPFISSQQPATAFPSLINSLMAQGLISLSKQPTVQDSVGTEFNPDVLKVRHESAINALYADLPRQCTTCGLRFKCQEEHSSHMDWHVTKNRMSKSRKQKPSRKWFVSQSMWLSGAEALGTEAVPGFLPTETMEEEKDDDELAVPADEDQNTCALCGEPFDAFYSDEMEEWMYKGAVYLNAPSGATAGMDTSQLGPIVHAKCRTESSMVSPEDFRQDEGGSNEEGRQRKRTRIY